VLPSYILKLPNKDTKMEYCCQTDDNWYDSIELPVSQPFYLLTSSSTDTPKCQMVKWTFSYLEYTWCIKKKVIELQHDIVSELLCVWTRFSHIRTDHAFSCWMISSSCQMDKKWANTNPIKNVSHNRLFSPLRVGLKPLKMNPLWYLSWWISLQ
jgi:hypothetical protein